MMVVVATTTMVVAMSTLASMRVFLVFLFTHEALVKLAVHIGQHIPALRL